MSDVSPWDCIAVPGTDFNVRQVAVKTAVPCFWGRDGRGACLFIVELEGDHVAQYHQERVTIRGIEMDLRSTGSGQQHLILTLHGQTNRDLFERLCYSLLEKLGDVADSASAMSVTLKHLRRWKNFLGERRQLLSAEETRGLFAELLFLNEMIKKRGARIALGAWLGSERSHQDFIFENAAVEIKAISGEERNRVRISSEDQLESLNDHLFLWIYRLSTQEAAKQAASLNEIVEMIHSAIYEEEMCEVFEQKLTAWGYSPLPDYDHPHFVVADRLIYRVAESFPRLLRSQLPTGISGVSYDIFLEHIEKFLCCNEEVFGAY